MKREIQPTELVELAHHLAGLDAGAGQASTVWLRRAISSAYYALFHELIGRATRKAIGPGAGREAERSALARWYQHADLRLLCGPVSDFARRAAAGEQVIRLLPTSRRP